MSLQAEHCVQILVLLYVELDQRTGWADPEKIVQHFKGKGVGEGRTRDALRTLANLQMTEENTETNAIKLSRYGVDWFEKTLPLVSREPEYEFALPFLRSIKLVGPEEFYGRNSRPKSEWNFHWTKWGTILTGLSILVAIVLWKLS